MKTKAIFKDAQKALDKERLKEQGLKNVIGFCFSNDTEIEKFATKCLKNF